VRPLATDAGGDRRRVGAWLIAFTDCVHHPKFRDSGQFTTVVSLASAEANERDKATAVLHYA
jgi:hypothetical protein